MRLRRRHAAAAGRQPASRRCSLAAARAARCTRSPASAIPGASSRCCARPACEPLPHPFPDHHRLRRTDLAVRRCAAGADDGEGCGKMPRLRARGALVPAGATRSSSAADASALLGRVVDGCTTAGNPGLPAVQGAAAATARAASVLVCRADRLAFPIRDGMPVMLEEEARVLTAGRSAAGALRRACTGSSFRRAMPSTRLPGKPLLELAGKPLIQWVYERALRSRASEVLVATDDERICRGRARLRRAGRDDRDHACLGHRPHRRGRRAAAAGPTRTSSSTCRATNR